MHFLLLCLALGQDPAPRVSLPPLLKAEAGEWVVVPVSATGPTVMWYFPDPGLQEMPWDQLLPPDVAAKLRGKMVRARTPGEYRLVAWTARGDVPSAPAVCVLVVAGTQPPPPGPPGPEPPPGPASKLWVVVVMDLDAKTLGQARIVDSPSLRDALEKAGHRWKLYDIRAAGLQGNDAWQKAIQKAGGVPCVILTEQGGSRLRLAAPLPASEAAFLELVRKAGGQ
jgi:hypothetical protein